MHMQETGLIQNFPLFLSYTIEEQPITIEEQPITQPTSEEQVESFIQHPEQMRDALVHIVQQANAQQTVVALLTQLLRRVEKHPQNAKQGACQIMMALPASIAQHLLEEQSGLFVQLFQCLDANQRREMLKHLTRQLENWKSLFEKVSQQNRQNLLFMAAWMDGLFYCQQEFSARNETMKQICDLLQKGSLTAFIQKLNDLHSKTGAYFMTCLSPEKFQEFISNVPYQISSKLLSNGLADTTTSQLLSAIGADTKHEKMIYESIRLDMENPVVPVEYYFTPKLCFDVLQQVSQADPDTASNYSPFIARLPPVLIGVLSINPDRREILLKLACKLSNEQLQFLACALPDNLLNDFIKKNWTSLSNNQYIAILETLSLSRLMSFIKVKSEQLQAVNGNFQDQYKNLQEKIEAIEEGELISSVFFNELKEQASDLHRLTQRPFHKDYHCLKLFLQQPHVSDAFPQQSFATLQPIIQDLQQTMNHLNSKRPLFEGPNAVMRTKLSALEECVMKEETTEEESDLTMILYQGFWTLVRAETWPYLGISPHSQLGITHPGQLILLGIKSDADLNLLGISPEWQNRVDTLATALNDLQHIQEEKMDVDDANVSGNEPKKISSFRDLWQAFISIKTPSNELNSICTNIIQTLPIQQLEPANLKMLCLTLGQALLMFQHLSESDRDNLKRGMQELERCQQTQILELGPKLLGAELMALRSQYPLFCLQRYLLDNKNLKQAWEKFRVQQCFSLTNLVEKGFVKTTADLLKLESVATGI